LGELGVDRRMVLMWILENEETRMWARIGWLVTGLSSELFFNLLTYLWKAEP
jgi:hypothetical protein